MRDCRRYARPHSRNAFEEDEVWRSLLNSSQDRVEFVMGSDTASGRIKSSLELRES